MPLCNKMGAFIPSEGGKHRLPPDVVGELEDAIHSAALTNASFDRLTDAVQVIVISQSGAPTTFTGSVTDFIRERVRLHHQSWVIGPLQRILAWSLSKDDGSPSEYRLTDRLDSDWPNPEVVDEMRAEIDRLLPVEDELHTLKSALEKLLCPPTA